MTKKPAGRPRGAETQVLAVRVAVDLRERLDRHLDYLETRFGVKSSRSAMIEHALRQYLDGVEKE